MNVRGWHAQWKVLLSEYDYKIFSYPGTQNGNTDTLSRLEEEEEKEGVKDEPKIFALQTMALCTQWMENSWYKDVYLWLENLTIQKESVHKREQVRKMAARYAIREKHLFYCDSDGGLKLYLGQEDIKAVLKEFHKGAIGGHFGQDITISWV